MKIAVASGKGGTGKTSIAVNLASLLVNRGGEVTYCDCDVEAPNGHLFLNPDINQTIYVDTKVPHIDESRCDGCGDCSRVCKYSAIVVLRKKVLLYPELCHSCGGCRLVCKKRAITEVDRVIGKINMASDAPVPFFSGELTIGEASAVPLIKRLKEELPSNGITIMDSPPGTSCPVIETTKDADYVVLVTEPTPFGLNDLDLAVQTMRKLSRPFGVVINRSDEGDGLIEDYCQQQGIPLIATIPFSREFAEAYSKGNLVSSLSGMIRQQFESLLDSILEQAGQFTTKPVTMQQTGVS